MSTPKSDSASYYDKFNAQAKRSRINERIIGLYKRIHEFGFHPDSSNLEIGCGPGKLTYLISRRLRKGSLESTDISPNSVALARSTVRHPNVSFIVSDALALEPSLSRYDNIYLFDVIEHIPLEHHPELFKRIGGWMDEQSRLLINIPNPEYLKFAHKYRPESLQIVDQPVLLDNLSAAIYGAGLKIVFFETYSIWAEDDYQFMVVKKQSEFKEVVLAGKRNFFQKVGSRLLREYRSIRYRQPRPLKS